MSVKETVQTAAFRLQVVALLCSASYQGWREVFGVHPPGAGAGPAGVTVSRAAAKIAACIRAASSREHAAQKLGQLERRYGALDIQASFHLGSTVRTDERYIEVEALSSLAPGALLSKGVLEFGALLLNQEFKGSKIAMLPPAHLATPHQYISCSMGYPAGGFPLAARLFEELPTELVLDGAGGLLQERDIARVRVMVLRQTASVHPWVCC